MGEDATVNAVPNVAIRRALVLAFASLATVHAASQQAPRFSATVDGVVVDVLVTKGSAPVSGLTARDFEIRDNGVLQNAELIESSDVPVNAVLALDMSASISGSQLADIRAASRALLAGLRPVDRVALTTFNHAVTPRVPLTAHVDEVGVALERVIPTGGTAVMDGLYVALMATHTEVGRTLVVLCTDGRDTASWLQPDEVMEAVRHSNAVIYTVAAGGARKWSLLKDVTEATGGHAIEIEPGTDVRGTFDTILREFRSRYVLTFVPSDAHTTGLHRLDVRVRRDGVTVQARRGYIGRR